MRVLLLKEVEHLGEAGQLVNVRPGYARNFLLPRHLAVPATEKAEAHARRLREAAAKRKAKQEAELQALADRLSGVSCSIPRKAAEDGKLFGSVTSADIAEALAAQGFQVDKRKIVLDEPFKTLGVFTVPVKLAPTVAASVKVWIVREGAAAS